MRQTGIIDISNKNTLPLPSFPQEHPILNMDDETQYPATRTALLLRIRDPRSQSQILRKIQNFNSGPEYKVSISA